MTTKTTLKSPLLGVITDGEVEEGLLFQNLLDSLHEQRNSTAHETLRSARKAAETDYRDNPTLENFQKLRCALEEQVIGQGEIFVKLRGYETEVRHALIGERVIPWAREILARALAKSESQLEEITKSEQLRHFRLTGEPLTNSDLIRFAQRPVALLKNLIAEADAKNFGGIFRTPRKIVDLLTYVGARAADATNENLGVAETTSREESLTL
jgi:hypothetical protein